MEWIWVGALAAGVLAFLMGVEFMSRRFGNERVNPGEQDDDDDGGSTFTPEE